MRFLFIGLFILPLFLRAQDYRSPDLDWSTLVGGPEHEEIYDIAELPNGYIMAVGYTSSKVNKREDQYYFILNGDGKKIISVNYGSNNDDRALGVTNTYDGKFVYCGYVEPFPGHRVPTVRKIDQTGKPIYSIIESRGNGFYKDIVELTPNKNVVIGEENGNGEIALYEDTKLLWVKSIPNANVKLSSIAIVTDSTFMITGQTTGDQLLWYALYNDHGKQLWAKKGSKYFGEGKAIIIENKQFGWIGGSYYESRTREDAYIMKIKIQDGNIVAKENYGAKYDDVLNSIALTPDNHLYLAGKTYSHIHGGAKRSKAWMVEIDTKTLKQTGDQFLWGGKQNNEITSIKYSGSGNIILGAFTSSGEAERQDGWVMEIPASDHKNDLIVQGIDLVDFNVIEANGDGKIGYTESSAFQVSYKRTSNYIPSVPKFIVYIDDQNVSYDVLLDMINQEGKFNIPYYRQNELTGIHNVRIVLLDGKNNRLDSIEKAFEFLPSQQSNLVLTFGKSTLKDKLDHGQAVIEIPMTITNTGLNNMTNIRTSLAGLEDMPYNFNDTLIMLNANESKNALITIKPQELFAVDTIRIKAFAQKDSFIISQASLIPVKALLAPWVKARKDQTTVLIAEKLSTKSFGQSGEISPITSDDYKKLPLDSFFLKQSTWKIEQGSISSTIKSFDANKIFMIWIDPDQVITKNYFVSKRNKHTILIKLINQDQDAEGLEPKIIIERPRLSRIDTISLSLDQGVLFGSYQYNLQSDINLEDGENKVYLTLWYRDELIKASNKMIIKYEPPKSNLFVYAYGIPGAGLTQVTKDASDLASAFDGQQGKLFSDIQSQVFNTKEQTTTQELKKSIRSISNDYFEFKRIRNNDVILIYISSHGSLVRDELRIQSSDFDPIFEDETTLNFQHDIQDKLRNIPCKKLFLIDACHSGAANNLSGHDIGTKGGDISDDLANALVKLSEASNDFYYLLSSSAGEVSYTDESWGNSAFTKGLLEAFKNQSERTLQGIQQADANHNKIIDLKELYDYIKERVPVIIQSKKDLKSSQTPYAPNERALKDISIFVLGQ